MVAVLCSHQCVIGALISLSTVPGDQLFSLTPGTLFLSLALPGHFFFIALILYLPLSIAGRLIHSKRRIVIPAAILFSLLVFIIFVDARIFELYRFHINGMVLNLLTGEEAAQILWVYPGFPKVFYQKSCVASQ